MAETTRPEYKNITVRFPIGDYNALRDMSTELDLSLNQLLRRFVKDALRKRREKTDSDDELVQWQMLDGGEWVYEER